MRSVLLFDVPCLQRGYYDRPNERNERKKIWKTRMSIWFRYVDENSQITHTHTQYDDEQTSWRWRWEWCMNFSIDSSSPMVHMWKCALYVCRQRLSGCILICLYSVVVITRTHAQPCRIDGQKIWANWQALCVHGACVDQVAMREWSWSMCYAKFVIEANVQRQQVERQRKRK